MHVQLHIHVHVQYMLYITSKKAILQNLQPVPALIDNLHVHVITELALRINNMPMMYMYTCTCMYHYRSLTYTQLYGWSSLLMLI